MIRFRRFALESVCAAALFCLTLGARAAHAYPYYDDGAGNGCVECHNQFQGGTGPLHTNHRVNFNIPGTACNLCHPSGGGSTPVRTYWSGPGGGYGCAGCHGQDYGETSPNSGEPKATAYGLRLVHVSLGYTQCGTGGCHAPGNLGHPDPFPPLLGEHVPPPYYGQPTNNLTDPCSSAQEDMPFDADSLGLDNDGDGARDYPADSDCMAPVTTTSTSTTTSTTLPFNCAAAPVGGCVAPGKGVFVVNDQVAGKEKMKLSLKKMATVVAPDDYGNPVTGNTKYKVCVYDGTNQLSGEYTVARAGDTCVDQPCFKLVPDKGYKYSDKDAASDGILKMTLFGGVAGTGKAKVIGKNVTSTLPLGVAAALRGETSATVQLMTSDAACFGVGLSQVKKADGTIFTAVGP